MDFSSNGGDQNQYIDTAIRAVKHKRTVPEIDFTLHTMEDGTQVSTLERVCKGMTYPLTHGKGCAHVVVAGGTRDRAAPT